MPGTISPADALRLANLLHRISFAGISARVHAAIRRSSSLALRQHRANATTALLALPPRSPVCGDTHAARRQRCTGCKSSRPKYIAQNRATVVTSTTATFTIQLPTRGRQPSSACDARYIVKSSDQADILCCGYFCACFCLQYLWASSTSNGHCRAKARPLRR